MSYPFSWSPSWGRRGCWPRRTCRIGPPERVGDCGSPGEAQTNNLCVTQIITCDSHNLKKITYLIEDVIKLSFRFVKADIQRQIAGFERTTMGNVFYHWALVSYFIFGIQVKSKYGKVATIFTLLELSCSGGLVVSWVGRSCSTAVEPHNQEVMSSIPVRWWNLFFFLSFLLSPLKIILASLTRRQPGSVAA